MGEPSQIPSAPRFPVFGSLLHLAVTSTDFLLRTAEALGDVYWLDLGRDRVLVVGSPEDARRILSNRNGAYPDKGGGTGFRRSSLPFVGAGLSTWNATDTEWRRRRRAFRLVHAMWRREAVAALDIPDWIDASGQGSLVDMVQRDVIGDLVARLLGTRPPIDEIETVTIQLRRLAESFWPAKFPGASILAGKRTQTATRSLESEVDRWCSRYLSSDPTTPFVDHCFRLGLDRIQVRNEVLSQLLSSGTLAVPAVWGLHLLAANPHIQSTLRSALLAPNEGVQTSGATADYLSWTVREVLRLCPATYWIQRHALKSELVGGHEIPAGTRVVILVPRVHQHPDYWSRPWEFQPERFSTPSEALKYWMPFGAGPRTCTAREYVVDSITQTLATVTRTYRISDSPHGKSALVPSFSLAARPAPRLQFARLSTDEIADIRRGQTDSR